MTFDAIFEINETGNETPIYLIYMEGAKKIWETFHDDYEIRVGSVAKAREGKNRQIVLWEDGRRMAMISVGQTSSLYIYSEYLINKAGSLFESSPRGEYRITRESVDECIDVLKEIL